MKTFSLPTKLYLYVTYLAGIVIFVSHVLRLELKDPWLLFALCVLASLALILKVEGSTDRSHYTFSFLIYGFAFAAFGATEAILVIFVSNIVEWIWNKPPWFIQLFNTTSYILVMEAAGLVSNWIDPAASSDSLLTALGIILSMATFNLLNHLMVGIIIWLARRENFKQSGVFEFFPLMLDLSLLYFGASLSIVWNYNPFAIVLFVIPTYLLYSTLRVPALERQTEIDSKTGLFNHSYFKKQIESELARSNRFDRPLSVIIADLDLLRNINNTYGHLAGDEVLIGVAKAMKQAFRDYDVVCRFGGEEFAVLLPETTLSQACERAEALRRTIEDLEFSVQTSLTPIRATMSFGVAQREDFSQDQDEIVHNADLALYHSKLSGRNRTFAFANNQYVDFPSARTNKSVPEQPATDPVDTVSNSRSNPAESTPRGADNRVPEQDQVLPETSMEKAHTKRSKRVVNLFIGSLALLAILAYGFVTAWKPVLDDPWNYDWLGLLAISVLIGISEGFSIDLYIRKSSVSTSAIPLLVAYLVFGPLGVIVASLVLAISLVIKYRSPFSRFVFNLSNHILVGSLTIGLLRLAGGNFLELFYPVQILLSLGAALSQYAITTWMVAIGMSLDLEHSAAPIWREHFSWLAPYYVGIGLIAYALIFGYRHDHVSGLLLMVIPMALLRISQMQYIERTRNVVTELREKNQILKKNSEEIQELNEGLLSTLSEIVDLRDPYVLGHSKQVSRLAAEIARLLGLNEKQIDLIRKAGQLHDIGKLGIPTELLSKPGKLTPEEYQTIKGHAAIGGELVKNSPSLRPIAPIIRHHHEYYNGMGYPDGLAGNKISIGARIVAVADAIEAMTSDRPYRRVLSLQQAVDELIRCSGSQFDPLVVGVAVSMLKEIESDQVVKQSQAQVNHPASHLSINPQSL